MNGRRSGLIPGLAGLLGLLALLPAPAFAAPLTVDRTVVRFVARELGGVDSPRFIYERELAFEARVEAMSEDPTASDPGYRPRHVRSALERHIAETVLASLYVEPPPTPREIDERVALSRIALTERVGGGQALALAAQEEGILAGDLFRILRRQALASLYLDRMVAPLLEPSAAELRSVLRGQRTPFSGRPFDEVEASLRRWYVGTRLEAMVRTYYDGLRTRVGVTRLP